MAEFQTAVTADEKYLSAGTSPDAALLRQPVSLPDGWSVASLQNHGEYGELIEDAGVWYYVLVTPYQHGQGGGTATDVDAAALNLAGSQGEYGLLTIKVSIISDITVLDVPESISGADEAQGEWLVNFGANSPGFVSWQDESGASHDVGDTVNFYGYFVKVDSGSIFAQRQALGAVNAQIAIIAVNSEQTVTSKSIPISLEASQNNGLAFKDLAFSGLDWL